jgi:hypothetical protein
VRRLISIPVFLLASCGGTWISPKEAYDRESRVCAAHADVEARRKCQTMVNHKYGSYLGEGDYPSDKAPQ